MDTINTDTRSNGKGNETMSFYEEYFRAKVEFQKVPQQQFPESEKAMILPSSSTKDMTRFFVSAELGNQIAYIKSNNTVVRFNSKSEADKNDLLERIRKARTVLTPRKEAFWDAIFDTLTNLNPEK